MPRVKSPYCWRGHEFTPENTYTIPKTGKRYCLACKKASNEKPANKAARAEGIKVCHIRSRYGLSKEQYETLLKDSEGRCAICHREYEIPFVDHDHETKKVREILCRFCNTGLGMFGDNQELLSKAIEYLKRHSNA